MSIRIAGQVIASAGSLTAHNEDPNAHPDIRELIGQGGGSGGYSKEEIDNKFTVVDTAILGNADAIQKTRSDFMESDSELQQQINAHASELTTQKNDIDELGDQVAGIESKIPEGTSDTNPLINKQQLLDEEMDIREDLNSGLSELQTQITAQASAIANKVDVSGDTMTGTLNLPELNVATSEGTLNLSITAGVATIATNNGLDIVSQTKFDTAPTTDDNTTWADALDTSLVRKAQVATAIAEASGGSVPDNVYTSYNLIAGDNVTFTEVPPEGGIDEHTLACWHFDENQTDEVGGQIFSTGNNTFLTGKFNKGVYHGASSNYVTSSNVLSDINFHQENNFTIDFWGIFDSSSSMITFATGDNATNPSSVFYFRVTPTKVYLADNYLDATYPNIKEVYEFENSLSYNVPFHVAIQREERIVRIFIDGKRILEVDFTGSRALSSTTKNGLKFSVFVSILDELRVSNNTRYTEDFTPPTQAYTIATGPSKTAVNAIVAVPTKTSELENDSGFLTGLPDNVYTKTNLLGGKDIEIVPEPVEGGIDEYTLGVGHFEGTSAGENSVEGRNAFGVSSGNLISDYSKFGTKCVYAPKIAYAKTGFTEDSDWTIDAWVRFYAISDGWNAQMGIGFGDYESYDLDVKLDPYNSKAYIFTDVERSVGTEKASATIPTIAINTWYHFAAEKHGNTITGYLDGNPVVSYTGSEIKNTGSYRYLWIHNNPSYADELRFSSIARYKGQPFTPPTEAYRVAEPTGNYVINNTYSVEVPTKTSQLTNDSGFITADDVPSTGGAFDFQGTEAEFDAAVEAGEITDDTVSLITDDTTGELVATKAELAAVDASKADTALSNVLANIDYVVESKFPTAEDPTWYRKYKSGWLEQGGKSSGASTNHVVTLLKPFADTNYSVVATIIGNNLATQVNNITINSFTLYQNLPHYWHAFGQGV